MPQKIHRYLIEEIVNKVENGSTLVETTNTNFSSVSEITNKVASLVGEISVASKEQADGVIQVNTAISEIDAVVQRVAAGAEEFSATAKEMDVQVMEMSSAIADMTTLLSGKKIEVARNADISQPQETRLLA
jgi:methyl-accepting chemotaxis protein